MLNIPFQKPMMPEKSMLLEAIDKLYENRNITNFGNYHNQLEEKLSKYLETTNFYLYNNGTSALIAAIKALNLKGEIITTSFTFCATFQAILFCGIKPVFCDINPKTLTIDTKKIESLINEKTSAILGVHTFGIPCELNSIDKLARKYNLYIIYDGAHAFNTKIEDKDISCYGDITMFSFHATKCFNTVEGGGLVYNIPTFKRRLDHIRNFGLNGEKDIIDEGFNAKLSEVHAIFGLGNLSRLKHEYEQRDKIYQKYQKELAKVNWLKTIKYEDYTSQQSFQYFPIIINEDVYINSNELHKFLLKKNIVTRNYFYPSCNEFKIFKKTKSNINNPISSIISQKTLCLPFYGNLSYSEIEYIVQKIKDFSK